MTTSGAFLLTDGNNQRPVYLQGLDRRAAGCGTPEQEGALPAEVVVPQVAPRMEEGDLLTTLRVDGSLTGCLAKRARNTGEGEIVAGVGTASGHRHDVVDVKGCFLSQLRKTVVLASVAGTPDNEPAEPGGDALSQVPTPMRRVVPAASIRTGTRPGRRVPRLRAAHQGSAPHPGPADRADPCRRSSTPRGSRKCSRSSGSSSLTRTC